MTEIKSLKQPEKDVKVASTSAALRATLFAAKWKRSTRLVEKTNEL